MNLRNVSGLWGTLWGLLLFLGISEAAVEVFHKNDVVFAVSNTGARKIPMTVLNNVWNSEADKKDTPLVLTVRNEDSEQQLKTLMKRNILTYSFEYPVSSSFSAGLEFTDEVQTPLAIVLKLPGRGYCYLEREDVGDSTSTLYNGGNRCYRDSGEWWREALKHNVRGKGANSDRFVFTRGMSVFMVDSRGEKLALEVWNDRWAADVSSYPLVLGIRHKYSLLRYLGDSKAAKGEFKFEYYSGAGGSVGVEFASAVIDPERIVLSWRFSMGPSNAPYNFLRLEKVVDGHRIQGEDASIYEFEPKFREKLKRMFKSFHEAMPNGWRK